MSINQITSELESILIEASKINNNGETSYAYVSGYLFCFIQRLASSLNPKKVLEEELEILKRKYKL